MNPSDVCLLVLGGEYSVPEKDFFSDISYVIACDKGYEYCKRLGITPDFLIGDFDSYKGKLPERIQTVTLKPEKDDSDFLSGLKIALNKGYKNYKIICGLGGRLDHTFSNLQTLKHIAESGGKACFASANEILFTLHNDSITIPKKEGYSLSVFSLSDYSYGVTERGTKYVVTDVTFSYATPLGLSNEWASEKAEISVKDGTLLIILSKLSD